MVRLPTGLFSTFDLDRALFTRPGYDPELGLGELLKPDDGRRGLHFLQVDFGGLNPRLLHAEIELARTDTPWELEDRVSHPEGLGRWERCLQTMVRVHGPSATRGLLAEDGLDGYPIPRWILAEAAAPTGKEDDE